MRGPNAGRLAPPSAGEKLAAHYGRLIIQGELQPGDLMPTVAEIVQERGCTRKVARAALWYLEKTWFVSAAIGSEYRGRYVVARQYAGRGDA